MASKKQPPKKADSAPEKKQDESKKATDSTNTSNTTTSAAPKKGSAKRSLNIFMIVILLLIAAGIYLYQKGYITGHYLIVKSENSHHSPLNNENGYSKKPEKTTDNKGKEQKPEGAKELSGTSEPSLTTTEHNEKNETPQSEINTNLDTPLQSSHSATELAALQSRIALLQAELRILKERTAENNAQETQKDIQDAVSSTLSGKVIMAMAWVDLKTKINQGIPFKNDLNNFKIVLENQASSSLSSDLQDALNILSEMAEIGVPSLSYVQSSFAPFARNLRTKEAYKNASGPLDKAKIFLSQFVSIKKTAKSTVIKTSSDTNTKTTEEKAEPQEASKSVPSALDNVENALRLGDVENALKYATDNNLITPTDDAWKMWLIHANAYIHIQKTMQTLQHSILKP